MRILSELESEWLSLRATGGKTDEHFFRQIKHLTIYGYYTSERRAGARNCTGSPSPAATTPASQPGSDEGLP